MILKKRFIKTLALILIPTFALSIGVCAVSDTKLTQGTTKGTYKTVIIDAGHGGEDGGAVGVRDVVEKDLNLPIALKTAEYLKKSGYKVILTRDADYAVYSKEAKTLSEKKVSDIHNRHKLVSETPNCIFVSIHMNHYDNPSCKGAQIFYSGNNEESKELAQSIQSSIKKSVQPKNERQIKESTSSIYLLYYATVPAVLVECGFISNPTEASLLQKEEYQAQIAQAVFDGVNSFCKTAQKNSSER